MSADALSVTSNELSAHTLRVGTSPDSVAWLLDNVGDPDFRQFQDQFSLAVSAVCDAIRRPAAEQGKRIARLAEVVNAWHVALTLERDESWVSDIASAPAWPAVIDPDELIDAKKLRALLAS